MFLLNTVNFAVTLQRGQPRVLTFEGIDADGSPSDFSTVTSNKLIISHAIGRDAASEIVTYTDKLAVVGTVLQAQWSLADIEELPLGTFVAELVVTDDDTNWYVSHQGTFSTLPQIYRPA